jgi:hypothetical protein
MTNDHRAPPRSPASSADQGYRCYSRGCVAGRNASRCCAQSAIVSSRARTRGMDAAGVDTLGHQPSRQALFRQRVPARGAGAAHACCSATAMADICRATLGDTAYFLLRPVCRERPEGGLPSPWHSGFGLCRGNRRPPDHAPYLTCWCPLDDSTEGKRHRPPDPGSHRGGIVRMSASRAPRPSARRRRVRGPDHRSEAGEVVAFSSLTLHATGANRSERPAASISRNIRPRPCSTPARGICAATPSAAAGRQQVTFG